MHSIENTAFDACSTVIRRGIGVCTCDNQTLVHNVRAPLSTHSNRRPKIYKIPKRYCTIDTVRQSDIRGVLGEMAPVSITQAQFQPLWLVSLTALSFSHTDLPLHEQRLTTRDLICSPQSSPEKASRSGVDNHGLGTGYAKASVVLVDAIGLLGTRCLIILVKLLLFSLLTYPRLSLYSPLSPKSPDQSTACLSAAKHKHRHHAHASRA